MFFDVGVAQCELFAAQFYDEVSLLEIFELVPLGGDCFGRLYFRFAKAFQKGFTGRFFAATVRKLVKIDAKFDVVDAVEKVLENGY